MKVSKTLIIAALLGAITQSQLVNAVKLEHHHHHHHKVSKHHGRFPLDIGVRFLETMADNVGGSVADAGVVEEAVPEPALPPVEEDADVVAAKAQAKLAKKSAETMPQPDPEAPPAPKPKETILKEKVLKEMDKKADKKVDATAEAKKSVETAAPPAPAKNPDELKVEAIKNGDDEETPQTSEEYKELKAKVDDAKAELDAEPAPLDEDAQADMEKHQVDQLVSEAKLNQAVASKKLKLTEISNLKKEEELAIEAAKNPENPDLEGALAEVAANTKKDEKQVKKLKEEIKKLDAVEKVEGKAKKERDQEAEAEAAEQKAAEDKVAEDSARLALFEARKKAADDKQSAQFKEADAAASDAPIKNAPLPEDKKLAIANAKIEKMLEEDEAAAAAKQKEIDDKKEEAGPNPGVLAAEEAQAKWDAEQAAVKAAEAVKEAAEAKEKLEAIKAQEAQAEQFRKANLRGEAWVSEMPDYILDSKVFKKRRVPKIIPKKEDE